MGCYIERVSIKLDHEISHLFFYKFVIEKINILYNDYI